MDPSLYNSMAINPLNATDSSPCMRDLPSLACLTSVRSDRLPSCSFWRQRCSLAPDAMFCALSTFIGVELHGEESSVVIHRTEHL